MYKYSTLIILNYIKSKYITSFIFFYLSLSDLSFSVLQFYYYFSQPPVNTHLNTHLNIHLNFKLKSIFFNDHRIN